MRLGKVGVRGLIVALLVLTGSGQAQADQALEAVKAGEQRIQSLIASDSPTEANVEARQWQARARADHEPLQQALAEVAIASLRRRAGAYDEAVPMFRGALAMMDEQTPDAFRARVLADLGITYALSGLHADALDYSRQALDLFRQQNDPQRVSAMLGNIGNLLGEIGDLEASREHYLAALDLKRSAGIERGVGGLYNNLADLARGEGDLAEARRLLEQAVEANRGEGRIEPLVRSLINLASLEGDLGDDASAREHLMTAHELTGEDALPLQAQAAYVEAKLDLNQFRAAEGGAAGARSERPGEGGPDGKGAVGPAPQAWLDSARRQQLRAADLARQIDDPNRRRSVALLGVEIESAAGDYRRALEWQRQAEVERVALDDAQAKTRQATLSAQYLDERRNRELLELRAREAAQQEQRARQQRWLWLLLSLLLIGSGLLLHLWLRARLRKRQSARLGAHVEALETALDAAEQMRQKAERLAELNRQLLRVMGDEMRRPALQVRRQAERLLVNDASSAERISGLSTIAQAASDLLRTSEQVLENSLGPGDGAAQTVDLAELLLGLALADRRANEPRIELRIEENQRPRVAVDGARLQLVLREWLALARELHGRDERLLLSLQSERSICRLLLEDPGELLASRLEQSREPRSDDARLGVLWLNQAVLSLGGRFFRLPQSPRALLSLELPLQPDDEATG